MMKPNVLPGNVQTLFTLARAIASVLAEKHGGVIVEPETESQLRASIAAATFARAAYEAILAGPRESSVVLATFSVLAAENDLSNIAEYVLSISTWPREFSPRASTVVGEGNRPLLSSIRSTPVF